MEHAQSSWSCKTEVKQEGKVSSIAVGFLVWCQVREYWWGIRVQAICQQASNCIKCNILVFYLPVLHRVHVCYVRLLINVKKKSYHPRTLLSLHANLGQMSEQVQIKPRTVLSKGLLEKVKLPGASSQTSWTGWLLTSLWFGGLGFCLFLF